MGADKAAAEVVVEAARLGEDIGELGVLERYARRRRFDTFALAVGTDLFTGLFSPPCSAPPAAPAWPR